jgi:hypothetical protein
MPAKSTYASVTIEMAFAVSDRALSAVVHVHAHAGGVDMVGRCCLVVWKSGSRREEEREGI